MREFIPLKFTSKIVEQDIMGICAVHGIDFREVEESLNRSDRMYILVEAGSIDHSKVDIGKNRFLENPSQRLNWAIYASLELIAFMKGERILNDAYDTGKADFLTDIRALCDRALEDSTVK